MEGERGPECSQRQKGLSAIQDEKRGPVFVSNCTVTVKCAIDTLWGQKTLLRVILIAGISVFSGITLESAEATSHDLGFAVVTQEIRLERDGGVLVVQMQSPPQNV